MDVQQETEPNLCERAREADVHAYEELVRRYQELAFRVAYHVLADASEAEDAAQEAFVKAYYAMGRFRAGSEFRPWLVRIVANEARNRRKSAARRVGLAEAAGREFRIAAPPASPEEDVEEAEQRRQLVDAVRGLREEDRMVVGCRFFLDLSESETASVIGCPRGTVKSRLSRAIARLREALPAAEMHASERGAIDG